METKLVLKLRKASGLGLLACKKALEEAGGDYQKAVGLIRKRGNRIATKKLEREMEEGALFAVVNDDRTKGVLIALGCETDFVAKTEKFEELAHLIALVGIEKSIKSKEALLGEGYKKHTVQEEIMQYIGVIGENISLTHYHFMEGPLLGYYIHSGNKLGALVVTSGEGERDDSIEAADQMALQVVAADPVAICPDSIDSSILEEERAIIRHQLDKENKPEAVKKKIEEGKLQKFFAEKTLLYQESLASDNMTNKEYLQGIDVHLRVLEFIRFDLS